MNIASLKTGWNTGVVANMAADQMNFESRVPETAQLWASADDDDVDEDALEDEDDLDDEDLDDDEDEDDLDDEDDEDLEDEDELEDESVDEDEE